MIKASLVNKAFDENVVVADAMAFSGVSIDSRAIENNQLFFAIKGERFDGHAYIDSAVEAGATGVIVSDKLENALVPAWKVKDTTDALGDLAKTYLSTLSLKKIAITGSAGKTSVKQMCLAILSEAGKAKATAGNLNNHIGAPLTALSMTSDLDFGVFELGANHKNEIAYTAGIVQPDVALINNVAGAHLEGFGSIEGVFEAKSEIYQSLVAGKTAVINLDDQFAGKWLEYAKQNSLKVVTFSLNNAEANVYAEQVELGMSQSMFVMHYGEEKIEVTVNLQGAHNVRNALAASAIAYALELTSDCVKAGLVKIEMPKGRLQSSKHASGAVLIDDAYNANEVSVKAAIDVLAAQGAASKKVTSLVLGSLGELGDYLAATCQAIAEHAMKAGIDSLTVVGSQASLYEPYFTREFTAFENNMVAADAIEGQLNSDLIVLFKGSRTSKMEQIIQELLKETA